MVTFSEALRSIAIQIPESTVRQWQEKQELLSSLENLMNQELRPILETVQLHYLQNEGKITLTTLDTTLTLRLAWDCHQPEDICSHGQEHAISLKLHPEEAVTVLIGNHSRHISRLPLSREDWRELVQDEILVALQNHLVCLCSR